MPDLIRHPVTAIDQTPHWIADQVRNDIRDSREITGTGGRVLPGATESLERMGGCCATALSLLEVDFATMARFQIPTMNDQSISSATRRRAYTRLVGQLASATGEERWRLLMAGHVLGQPDLRLHLDSHLRMLRQAFAERDAREAAGQLLRIALVPIGHAVRRLPAGNVGRATVNAFAPMVPPREVGELVDRALRPLPAEWH